MIAFEGIPSQKTQKFILKKYFQNVFPVGLFCILLICIPLIVLLATYKKLSDAGFIICICCSFIGFILTIFCFTLPFILLRRIKSFRIEIDEENISYSYIDENKENSEIYCNFERIKKIVDYGDYYYFYFYYPTKMGACACQKDLIVEGSIEEFEKLFEGKIIRKIKS